MLASDPTEAADSANILPAIADLLPGAVIVPMGGIFYILAGREAFGMFDERDPAHIALLELMFEYERQFRISAPEMTIQALAYWRKTKNGAKPTVSWLQCIPDQYRNPLGLV